MVTEVDSFDRAGELVAKALLASDPQLAELLLAQHEQLRADTPENRARVKNLLQGAAPKMPRAHRQFAIVGDLFAENLTLLEDDEGAYVWVYDDDIVSLDDVDPGGDPWKHNVDAQRRVRELFGSWRASLVRSVRLCLFGGSRGMAQVLFELGAAERVSHLELRTQKQGEAHVPIASAFPALRGLTCAAGELGQLFAAGAPELRSLVVHDAAWEPHVAELAARAPKLRHLGLLHAETQPADLDRLASHAVMNQITSLEIFATNYASRFPFDALLAKRDAFAYFQHIYLAGHLVPEEVRARFEDWPQVELVTWDRRETMAIDFQTMGWGASAR